MTQHLFQLIKMLMKQQQQWGSAIAPSSFSLLILVLWMGWKREQ